MRVFAFVWRYCARVSPATFRMQAGERASSGTRIRLFLGCNCNHAQRAAGTADYLQRRGNDHGTRRGKLIEIAQAGQTKLTAAVHKVVVRKWWIEGERLTGVGPDGFNADA